jgi:hypothetical protein
MTNREELDLLKQDPKGLSDYYIEIIVAGGSLTFEQIIRLEAAKKMTQGQ